MEGGILSLRVHCSVTANDLLLRSRRGSALAGFQILFLPLSPNCAAEQGISVCVGLVSGAHDEKLHVSLTMTE